MTCDGFEVQCTSDVLQLGLESIVPQDHLLRLVSAHVDLSFVRGVVKDTYTENGRPSTDPLVLFKISLIGFLYGIRSERRLASEIQLNLAYRWFLGYDFDEATPDHTALTKARARFGQQAYEEFSKASSYNAEITVSYKGRRST